MVPHRLFSTLALSLSSLLLASQITVAQQPTTASDAQLAAFGTPTPFRQFVHVANEVNIFGNHTVIDHPTLNGHPEAIVYATTSSTPDGRPGIYNEHRIGVWYNGANWTVFTQDPSEMPVGAAFNIRVGGGFRHQATVSNTAAFWTEIDNPVTNANPDALLLVTPVYDSVDAPVYVDHIVSVLYDGSREKWTLVLNDLSRMPEGAAFNVLVGRSVVHEARTDNTTGNLTFIDDPRTNGNPEAKILVTLNNSRSNPDSPVNDHPIGVFYNGVRWAIANQDQAEIPSGTAFNVFVANPPRITNAFFRGKKLVVEVEGIAGEGWVLVDGVSRFTQLDLANQKLTIFRMSKAIPVGATATIEVQDEDGVMSDAFSFTRK